MGDSAYTDRYRKDFFEKYGYYPSESDSVFDLFRQTQGKATPTAEQVMSGSAQGLIKQTDPLRKSLINQSRNFLNGGFDPASTPEFSAIRSFADQQADQARKGILETLPSGGVLLDKL